MIIAIVTPKGGEGKTTSALLLTMIESETKKVLGIDFDPQNSFTYSLGLDYGNDNVKVNNIATFMHTEKIDPIKINENLDFIPSSFKLSSMRTMPQNELKKALVKTGFDKKYDRIIIDTSPAYDNFFLTVGYAADVVIYPIRLRSVFSQKCLFETIEMLDAECPSVLHKMTILPTFFENTKDEQNIIDYIQSQIGDGGQDCFFETRIPETKKALRITADIESYDDKIAERLTEPYRHLAREIGEKYGNC